MKGILGRKLGMTQIFDDQGVAYPVTLIEAGPCYVTQIRLPERDGYAAVQLGLTVGCASLSSAGRVMVTFVVPDSSQPWGIPKVSRA